MLIIIMILIDDDDEDPLASHLCDDHDHDEGRSISPALSNPPLHLNLQQLFLEIHRILSNAFLFDKRWKSRLNNDQHDYRDPHDQPL